MQTLGSTLQAGATALIPPSRSVDITTGLLKRWYVIERSAMHTLAGWLPAIATQEIKALAARHLWMDAVSADELRTRVLQLRYPRRDLERKWEEGTIRLMEAVRNAPDELCLIGGLYRVVKPALTEAYRRVALQAGILADEPTKTLLQHVLETRRVQVEEMLPLLQAAEAREPAGAQQRAEWQAYLQAVLEATGGVAGTPSGSAAPDRRLERPFERPTAAQRDPRYQRRCELIGHSPIFWRAQDPGMMWVGYCIAHFNELWASEMAASVLYMNPDAPWNLLLDAARWCYDEARHFQLGQVRLERAGADIFADVPAPDTITFDCYEPDQQKLRLLAVHGFERGGVVGGGKQAAMKWHQQVGDPEGSQHFDFDWADESIHLQYGVEWLRHLYGEEILDSHLDERITEAILHRGRLIEQMFATEGEGVEPHARYLCQKLKVPFAAGNG